MYFNHSRMFFAYVKFFTSPTLKNIPTSAAVFNPLGYVQVILPLDIPGLH